VYATFDGGQVTAEEIRLEAAKLPPLLRTRFETDNGRRELVNAMVDKRLLLAEAQRRKHDKDPDVVRQVRELEERLAIQALLASEEKLAGSPSEAELRAWFEEHRGELSQGDRVRVRRILASAAPGASAADRQRARARAGAFASRLQRGEPFDRVAGDGDGPEKTRGGDMGLLMSGSGDPRIERAAFGLARVGERTDVVECADGYALLELIERRPGRSPTFEESRSEVENRVTPERKRRAFEELLGRLRRDADVRVTLPASTR
jgi:peptidyl-prolyl cis-trans isomerase C